MSQDKSVTETKPDQSSISREKQRVKRRRQREYRLYFHRDCDDRLHSLSTRPPEIRSLSTSPPEEDGLPLFFIVLIEGVIISVVVTIFKFFVW